MEHDQFQLREPEPEFAGWDGNWDDLWVHAGEPRHTRSWPLVICVLAGAILLGGALGHVYKMSNAPNITDPMLRGWLNRGLSGLKVSETAGGRTSEAPSDPQRTETAETPQTESALPKPNTPEATQPAPTILDLTSVMDTPAPRVPRSEVATPNQASFQKPINPAPIEQSATAITPQEAHAATEQAVAPAPLSMPKAEAAAMQVPSFVAVLAPQKSRMDALLNFADLQQRYSDVLSAMKVNIREINLGAKGIWYRAVVGAPGTHDAASYICKGLKSAGYDGCSVIRAP